MPSESILEKVKNVHFVGIGGSGMYPLAKILKDEGYIVSGSDNYLSDTLQDAISSGFKIYEQHDKNNLAGVELVVYSAAIKSDNPELIFAKMNNIPTLERAKLLGIVMNRYKKLVAVSGTHGKTTTSAMLTHIFVNSGLDPTAVIGGKLKSLNGNSRLGHSEFAVCEACEYVDTFLNLNPRLGVILNVEEDHLDYFKNIDGVLNSFTKFANNAKDCLVINADDLNSVKVTKNFPVKKIGFGLKLSNFKNKKIFDKIFIAKDIKEDRGFYSFSVLKDGKEFLNINLKIPGKHNIYNALACVAVADFYNIPEHKIKNSIETFSGVHRRFEILAVRNGITVMDDFAHHPTEITSTLNTVAKMGYARVIAVFQPHTYSRTYAFLKEFGAALSLADLAIVSEILAVREKNRYNIYSEDLVKLIKNGKYIKTFKEITDYVLGIAKPGDLILTMGGGNIYKCANEIAKRIKNA